MPLEKEEKEAIEAKEKKEGEEREEREERANDAARFSREAPTVSVQIPHFDLPFRYNKTAPAVNEQGSENDIVACVVAVLRTVPGQFLDLPAFGLEDLTFSQEPLTSTAIATAVAKWEPRANALVTTNISRFDEAVEEANILVRVT